MKMPSKEHWDVKECVDENGDWYEEWSAKPGSEAEEFIEYLNSLSPSEDKVIRPTRIK